MEKEKHELAPIAFAAIVFLIAVALPCSDVKCSPGWSAERTIDDSRRSQETDRGN